MPTLINNSTQKALTTVARAKSFLGISSDSQDSLLTMLINMSTGMIEQYLKRSLLSQTYTNQEVDGTGHPTITLRNWPVTSISSFQYRNTTDGSDSWGTFDAEDYRFYDYGVVELVAGQTLRVGLKYRFTYVAGYLIDFANENTPASHTLPQEIEYACLKIVARMFNARRAEGFKATSQGSSNVTMKDSVIDDPEVHSILDRYAGATI